MDVFAFNASLSMCKDVAGIAGNIFAFGLFVSPMPTFRRIMRNKSTEQFSGLPYIYALLNCLICLWYGTPFISHSNAMLMTVNSVGATFQLCYIILFIMHTDKKNKMKMLGLLFVVFAVVGVIVAGSLQIPDQLTRWYFVGFLSCGSLVSMFASPLFVINLVIRTKSVEFMPFYLSLSTFLMSASFLLYGLFNSDAFVYTPNGIGTILGIVQLALYCYYHRNSIEEETKEPLIVSYV
ncbi:Bidirectional sugar transporter SWEET2 [Arabidopsis thaliana]|jgi:solute carrier family 50 protein (sugar transporter)|uniref:Bidirectional sugar transporter SWEET2 n=4 Tax=Arabidopsis TaxID=3701 RepID=SWET2_ARATH|nr:Nodulin MtN3 family protein [Arabidopsis thaliana]Q9LH79.1 RecName: Full=Bidirectional sugar transporter SWEET2; Short=AtSWEET2; AltName: Full=Protein SUGARS WILL EVENTUALLY BE EXPORTED TRANSPORTERS 2 [Arabidopsis thaliana]KAG7625258.1 SWEET sugar transporter [Arabidopsis thaliana x Arabidopsis arenosa]KAG7631264.1 SWEET sugar transporter [Arabidopsis suecica]AAL06889.1 AT3g14770/T21E2_2 [Arabidopsis thaliana]AAL47411.1 AT3g14770/T21E2_2 [Arabidopsis thaliana]AEE75565.1 Nodulin MtN3 family|eukprot:NP_566493.1 Nodulin MtN3 family protein [Arabidopsis thaliana]